MSSMREKAEEASKDIAPDAYTLPGEFFKVFGHRPVSRGLDDYNLGEILAHVEKKITAEEYNLRENDFNRLVDVIITAQMEADRG